MDLKPERNEEVFLHATLYARAGPARAGSDSVFVPSAGVCSRPGGHPGMDRREHRRRPSSCRGGSSPGGFVHPGVRSPEGEVQRADHRHRQGRAGAHQPEPRGGHPRGGLGGRRQQPHRCRDLREGPGVDPEGRPGFHSRRLRAAPVRRRGGKAFHPRLRPATHLPRPRPQAPPGWSALEPRRRLLRLPGRRAARGPLHRGVPRRQRAGVRLDDARRRHQLRFPQWARLPAAPGARRIRLVRLPARTGELRLRPGPARRLRHPHPLRAGRLPRARRAEQPALDGQYGIPAQGHPRDPLLPRGGPYRLRAAGQPDEGPARSRSAAGRRRQRRAGPEARFRPPPPVEPHDQAPRGRQPARLRRLLVVQAPRPPDLPGARPEIE